MLPLLSKPWNLGPSWDLKGTRVQDGLSAQHDMMTPKLEGSLVLPHLPEVPTSRTDLQAHQVVPERSAFSPPSRNFSPIVDMDCRAAQGHILTKISKENTRQSIPLSIPADAQRQIRPWVESTICQRSLWRDPKETQRVFGHGEPEVLIYNRQMRKRPLRSQTSWNETLGEWAAVVFCQIYS